MTGVLARWDRFLNRQTSTRSSALLRLLLPLLLWARFANELLVFRDLDPARIALSINFFASTTLMWIGWKSRWATAWAGATALSMVYGFGVWADVEPWVHHHTTFVAHCTALLALTPCGDSFSVDRWLVLQKARAASRPPPAERGATWGLGLIALQTSTLYAFSAWDKTQMAFLSGQRLEHIFHTLYWGADPIPLLGVSTLFACAAILTVIVEYALALTLFIPRLQRASIAVGLMLHAAIYLLLPVSIFTLTVWATYLAYLDPDRVNAVLRPLLNEPPDPANAPAPPA